MNKKGYWFLVPLFFAGMIMIAGFSFLWYEKIHLFNESKNFCENNNLIFIKVSAFVECSDGVDSSLYSYKYVNGNFLFYPVKFLVEVK